MFLVDYRFHVQVQIQLEDQDQVRDHSTSRGGVYDKLINGTLDCRLLTVPDAANFTVMLPHSIRLYHVQAYNRETPL